MQHPRFVCTHCGAHHVSERRLRQCQVCDSFDLVPLTDAPPTYPHVHPARASQAGAGGRQVKFAAAATSGAQVELPSGSK
jgi:hypothetical protein